MCRPRETNVLDPPPSDHWTPLLKSDDLFLGNQEILDPPFQKSWTRPWSVCLCVCLCVVCVHDNLKNNGSIHLKLEHIVVYENSSDKFDIGHCPIKVKVIKICALCVA